MGVMERRRTILLNEPYPEHTSGYNFSIDAAEPVIKGAKIYLYPKMKGTGVPSASNRREPYFWKAFNINVGNKTYGKSGIAESSYLSNGYFDAETGILSSYWGVQVFDGTSGVTSYSNKGDYSIFWLYTSNIQVYNSPEVTLLSNMFTWKGINYNYGSVPDWSFCGAVSYPNSFWMRVPNSALPDLSLEGVKTWMASNKVTLIGPRRSNAVVTYDLGTLDIRPDRGVQQVTVTGTTQNNTVENDGSVIAEFDYWTR